VRSTEHETGQFAQHKSWFSTGIPGCWRLWWAYSYSYILRVRSDFYIQISVETGTCCVICPSQILSLLL